MAMRHWPGRGKDRTGFKVATTWMVNEMEMTPLLICREMVIQRLLMGETMPPPIFRCQRKEGLLISRAQRTGAGRRQRKRPPPIFRGQRKEGLLIFRGQRKEGLPIFRGQRKEGLLISRGQRKGAGRRQRKRPPPIFRGQRKEGLLISRGQRKGAGRRRENRRRRRS